MKRYNTDKPDQGATWTRRSTLKFAAGAVVAGSAGIPLLTAQAQSLTPKKGGNLRFGLNGGKTTGETLDPATLSGGLENHLAMQLRNCLVEINSDLEAIPELAESWEPSKDAKRWEFKIRKGVEFHNGKTMTVDDVLYSINYHRADSSKSAAKSLLVGIASIKAQGPDSIVFELSEGNADFPYVLSDYHIQIVPDGATGSEFSKGVGTGGYIMEKHERGVRALTRRNPNYFKSDRAHFDSVENIVLNDDGARMNAIATSAVDCITPADLKTLNLLLNQRSDLESVISTGRAHVTMAMRVDQPPFDNADLRLALKYAIDRDEIVKKVLQGYGSVGNDQPINSAYRFFDASQPQRHYDPEKAQFHYEKAGSPAVKLQVCDDSFGGAVDTALLFQQQAARAGINLEVVREPSDGYWERVWLKAGFTASNWNGRPTEDMMFSLVYASDAAWNETAWKDDQFNELLHRVRAEFDESKRRSMFAEMQRLVRDEGGAIIPFFNSFAIVSSKQLAHGKVAANAPGDGQRLPERWWFA